MSIIDDDSSPQVCPHGHWIEACDECLEARKRVPKSSGLQCGYCKTLTVYKFGDHYECINPKHPKYPGSASEVLTHNTKTWNDK